MTCNQALAFRQNNRSLSVENKSGFLKWSVWLIDFLMVMGANGLLHVDQNRKLLQRTRSIYKSNIFIYRFSSKLEAGSWMKFYEWCRIAWNTCTVWSWPSIIIAIILHNVTSGCHSTVCSIGCYDRISHSVNILPETNSRVIYAYGVSERMKPFLTGRVTAPK